LKHSSCLQFCCITNTNIYLLAGVNPKEEAHKEYLDKLCVDFEARMMRMILEGIAFRDKAQIDDPLYREVSQHLLFCHSKCFRFSGRHDLLEVLAEETKQNLSYQFFLFSLYVNINIIFIEHIMKRHKLLGLIVLISEY